MKSDVGKKTQVHGRVLFYSLSVFFILIFLLSCTCQAVEKRETQISMVITPENPPAGVAYTVTGILSDVSGAPLGNKRVILETSPDGNLSFPFEQVAVVTTDRTGHFEFFRGNHTPTEYIRVSYGGNNEFLKCVSEVVFVHAQSGHTITSPPSRTTGGLMLTGDPEKSLVLLDGELRGMTPLTLSGIEAGPHILEIGKPGYQNQTLEIFIAPDRKTTFSFSLPPAGINLENAGIESKTGLFVFQNTSYQGDMEIPHGEPIFSVSKAGISVDIYGNNSSVNGTKTAKITTLYDEQPFGNGFSMSVIITSDDTPFR